MNDAKKPYDGSRLLRAVAYIRASKEEQVLSPEAQREAIRVYAEREGLEVVEWYVEAVSGGAMLEDRPVLAEAITGMKDHNAYWFIVAKRDRLARDVVAAALVTRMVERSKGRVVSVAGEGNGTEPQDVLMRTIIDAFSEYERALIRSRTKAALATKARKHERTGGIPFGYKLGEDGKTLLPDAREQMAVNAARVLKAEGKNENAIATALNAAGFRSKAGTPFQRVQVTRMLARAS